MRRSLFPFLNSALKNSYWPVLVDLLRTLHSNIYIQFYRYSLHTVFHLPMQFKYNGKVKQYKLAADMPIIVTQNLKKHEMYNMMEFTIGSISENSDMVNNIWCDMKDFRESFIPGFCCKVYKYQGADIDQHYNIYDVNRMDKKQLYTCLSRTTKYEYIHLDSHELNYCYRIREQPRLELVNSHFNSDYLKGKIYKISLEKCDKVYIGSTCEKLETRLKWPVSNNTSQVFKNKRYNPKIELVVKVGNCLKEWRIYYKIWQQIAQHQSQSIEEKGGQIPSQYGNRKTVMRD